VADQSAFRARRTRTQASSLFVSKLAVLATGKGRVSARPGWAGEKERAVEGRLTRRSKEGGSGHGQAANWPVPAEDLAVLTSRSPTHVSIRAG
jgi:hypothetical protein